MTASVIQFPGRRRVAPAQPKPSLAPELTVSLIRDLVRRGRVARALKFAEGLPPHLAQAVEAASREPPGSRR